MTDLYDKFDCLQDLSIPEEMLGAYIEGNLKGSEFREVDNLLRVDENLSDLVYSVESDELYSDFDAYAFSNTTEGGDSLVHNFDDTLHLIELPQIKQICSPLEQPFNDIICAENDNMSDMAHIQDNDADNNEHQDNEHNINDSFDVLGMTDNLSN